MNLLYNKMSVPKNHQQVLEFMRFCIIRDGQIITPKLYSMTKTTSIVKYNMWQGFIGIDGYMITKSDVEDRTVNWDGPVKIWTASGRLPDEDNPEPKITISGKTTISNGKNIGRTNFTTSLTQAILQLRTKFNDKIKAGNVADKSQLITGTVNVEALRHTKGRGIYWWRVFPMAVHNLENKAYWKHVEYPVYVQKKLDGTRMIITKNRTTNKIEAYSRGRETINTADHIIQELGYVFDEYPDLYLDGEYYKHGSMLQEISGMSRRDEGDTVIRFHVFDSFIIGKEERYEDRRDRLLSLFADKYLLNVVLVEDIIANNRDGVMKIYKKYLKDGYEGVILRNFSSYYEYGINKEIRSYKTLKLKPRPDMDYPVVGYTQGEKGKDVGAVVWVCTITNETINKSNEQFSDKYPNMIKNISELTADSQFTVTPNIPYKARYEIFKKLEQGDISYMNKLGVIQFSSLSIDTKPQQPKFLGFKDKSYEEEFYKSLSGGDT